MDGEQKLLVSSFKGSELFHFMYQCMYWLNYFPYLQGIYDSNLYDVKTISKEPWTMYDNFFTIIYFNGYFFIPYYLLVFILSVFSLKMK